MSALLQQLTGVSDSVPTNRLIGATKSALLQQLEQLTGVIDPMPADLPIGGIWSKYMLLGGYPFTCVPLRLANFNDVAAIYAILNFAQDGSYSVLDIGQSGKVETRIDSHDRRASWFEQATYPSNIWVGIFQMPTAFFAKEVRLQIENQLRTALNPKCGVR